MMLRGSPADRSLPFLVEFVFYFTLVGDVGSLDFYEVRCAGSWDVMNGEDFQEASRHSRSPKIRNPTVPNPQRVSLLRQILPRSWITCRFPVHRWFRYSAGFSGAWVRERIRSAKQSHRGEVRVLRPVLREAGQFSLEAEEEDVPSIGVRIASVRRVRIAKAKITSGVEAEAFNRYARLLSKTAEGETPDVGCYPELIQKCYPPEVLAGLDQLRKSWMATKSPLFRTRMDDLGRHPSPVLSCRNGELAVHPPEEVESESHRGHSRHSGPSPTRYSWICRHGTDRRKRPSSFRGMPGNSPEYPTNGPAWSSRHPPTPTTSITRTRLDWR